MKPSSTAIVANRRLKVEQLLLRGLSQREILKAFQQQRIVNPKSGKPWSLATINSDIQALESDWDASALELKRKRKARVAAEIKELKRAAWADRDLRLVKDLLKDEVQLFNLADPIDVNVHVGVNGQVDVVHKLDEQAQELSSLEEAELDLLIENLAVIAGVELNADIDVIEGELVAAVESLPRGD